MHCRASCSTFRLSPAHLYTPPCSQYIYICLACTDLDASTHTCSDYDGGIISFLHENTYLFCIARKIYDDESGEFSWVDPAYHACTNNHVIISFLVIVANTAFLLTILLCGATQESFSTYCCIAIARCVDINEGSAVLSVCEMISLVVQFAKNTDSRMLEELAENNALTPDGNGHQASTKFIVSLTISL